MSDADLSPENLGRLAAAVPAQVVERARALSDRAPGLACAVEAFAAEYAELRDAVLGTSDTSAVDNGGDLGNAVLAAILGLADEALTSIESAVDESGARLTADRPAVGRPSGGVGQGRGGPGGHGAGRPRRDQRPHALPRREQAPG